MRKYHFSARFKGCEFNYHGVFETSFADVDEIVKKAKVALLQKISFWNLKPENLTCFEIYFFEGETEKSVFNFSL